MNLKTASIILYIVIMSAYVNTQAYAQTATSSPVISQPMAASSDYFLPFPGILPDNSLYFLKTFRDRVVSFFISDPLKRSSFDLLQSDKRMNSVTFLSAEPKPDRALMITTISKALNYYEEGINELRTARKIGESVTDLKGQYRNAASRYEELLQSMQTTSTGSFLHALSQNETRLLQLEKQGAQIKEK